MAASSITTTVVDGKYELIDFGVEGVQAAFSLRNPAEPDNYSMRRPQFHDMTVGTEVKRNWRDYAGLLGFELSDLIMSRRWTLHGSRVLHFGDIQPHQNAVWDDRTDSWNPRLLPGDKPGMEHSMDGLIGFSRTTVYSAQNADCPMVFMYDPVTGAFAIVHASWRTVGGGIITNAVTAFMTLGSNVSDIRVYASPGAGDEIQDFQDDALTRPFLEAHGRAYLLDPNYGFFRPFDPAVKERYQDSFGEPTKPFGDTVLAVSAIIESELLATGLQPEHVLVDYRSGILDPTIHSLRRDGIKYEQRLGDDAALAGSGHGLSTGTIRYLPKS